MREITFEGEGPSPRDISREYLRDEPPPLFDERYPGELRDMYRANGLKIAVVVLGAAVVKTVDEILQYPGVKVLTSEDGDRLGPVIDKDGLVTEGLAIWRPKDFPKK